MNHGLRAGTVPGVIAFVQAGSSGYRRVGDGEGDMCPPRRGNRIASMTDLFQVRE
jgi:hypothetical protein